MGELGSSSCLCSQRLMSAVREGGGGVVVLSESTYDIWKASHYRDSPFLWLQAQPTPHPVMGAALTNASEVELSCGHGDVLIGLIV